MCVTDHHDMTLAVKVALNPNTTNQLIFLLKMFSLEMCLLYDVKSHQQ